MKELQDLKDLTIHHVQPIRARILQRGREEDLAVFDVLLGIVNTSLILLYSCYRS